MSCNTRKLTIERSGYTSIEIEEHPNARVGFFLWLNPSETLSDTDVDSTETKRQAGHGIEPGLASYNARVLSIDIELVAASHSALITMENNLKKILALPAVPDYSDDGFVLIKIDDEDGNSKQFYARIYGSMPTFDMLIDPSQRRRRCSFALLADDPIMHNQTLDDSTGPESFYTTEFVLKDGALPTLKDGDLPTLKDDIGSELTVSNDGTIGVAPEFIITGATEDPVIENVTTGKKMEFTRGGGVTLASDEYITINVSQRTAVKTDSGGSETNVAANLSLDSEWIYILPGDNVFTLFDDTTDALDGQLQVKFRDGWI